jgi:hypothetical protein
MVVAGLTTLLAGCGGSAPDETGDAAGGGDAASSGDTGGPLTCSDASSPYAGAVVSHLFGPGQDFGQDEFPDNVFGPPRGGGAYAGSLDVVSLGDGGTIVLAFEDNAIIDGPGPDLLVFENPFQVGGSGELYAELGTVAVSDDGVTWAEFPCQATEEPFGSCAGWHPVFANVDENAVDPLDPEVAGGDPFDLAEVALTTARYVRITDRPDPDDVFDLDAVAIVHAACP